MATQITRHQMEFTGGDAVVNGWRQIGAAARTALRETANEASKVPPHLKAISAAYANLRGSAQAMAQSLGPVGVALAALGPGGIATGAAIAGTAALATGLGVLAKHAVETAAILQRGVQAIEDPIDAAEPLLHPDSAPYRVEELPTVRVEHVPERIARRRRPSPPALEPHDVRCAAILPRIPRHALRRDVELPADDDADAEGFDQINQAARPLHDGL